MLGAHAGQDRFTVGQRRGIGIASSEPLYVLRKEPERNLVVVGPRSALATSRVAVTSARLHRPAAAVDSVKLRYRSGPVPCRVEQPVPAGEHDRLILALARTVDGTAPGQTIYLMRGDTVVGAATIEERTSRNDWRRDDGVLMSEEPLAS